MALLLVVTWNVRRLSVRNEQEEAEKCGGEGEAGEMGDGVANWAEGRWGGSGLVGGGRGEGGGNVLKETSYSSFWYAILCSTNCFFH